jgi:anti-sigma regulatory factor (Ser/Thr protein kinase)
VSEVSRRFEPTDSAPLEAREFLRSALATWALDGLGEITELLTTELISNVVRHTDSRHIGLRASKDATGIRVEVTDNSPEPPSVQHPRTDQFSGRGLLLVERLASAWGTIPRPGKGKTVWFTLDTPPPTTTQYSPTASPK